MFEIVRRSRDEANETVITNIIIEIGLNDGREEETNREKTETFEKREEMKRERNLRKRV